MNRKKHKVVLAVSGTGGHLFPAQAFARSIQKILEEIEIIFAGKGLKTSLFFGREQFAYTEIEAAPFKRRKVLSFLWSTFRGIVQGIFFLKREKPSLVVGFGSFHSFPVLCAAKILQIPIVLFEANAIPGKVNRLFSKKALFSALYFPCAGKMLKGKKVTVHMPMWHERSKKDKLTSAAYFSLDKDKITFLVFGGSQGAQALNKNIPKALSLLGEHVASFQVIHITGSEESITCVEEAYEAAGIQAAVKSFESEMSYAWSFCDVAICRAGAGTVSELTLFEVPAVLIPYPHATDKHQYYNAATVAQMGGGVLCSEQENLEKIAELMRPFLEEPHFLSAKKEAIALFKEKNSLNHLHELIKELVEK